MTVTPDGPVMTAVSWTAPVTPSVLGTAAAATPTPGRVTVSLSGQARPVSCLVFTAGTTATHQGASVMRATLANAVTSSALSMASV